MALPQLKPQDLDPQPESSTFRHLRIVEPIPQSLLPQQIKDVGAAAAWEMDEHKQSQSRFLYYFNRLFFFAALGFVAGVAALIYALNR